MGFPSQPLPLLVSPVAEWLPLAQPGTPGIWQNFKPAGHRWPGRELGTDLQVLLSIGTNKLHRLLTERAHPEKSYENPAREHSPSQVQFRTANEVAELVKGRRIIPCQYSLAQGTQKPPRVNEAKRKKTGQKGYIRRTLIRHLSRRHGHT